MVRYIFLLCFVVAMLVGGCSTGRCEPEDAVYLYSSFRGNGEDGLHLAYSNDGYKWTDLGGPFLMPEVGKKSKLMRDPSIIQGPDGMFHMVWTTGWFGETGIGYAQSTDLINWSAQKYIEVMAHEPETQNVWAPELYYNAKDKVFVICWASTIKGRYRTAQDSPEKDHRMYCTTTKDFKSFTDTKLFFEHGFGVIDAIIVERAGDYVLVLKDESRTRSLRVAFSDSYLGPFDNISETFTEEFTEGPSMLKLGDEWIIYFDMYMKHQYGAVKTRDFKNWTDITGEISMPEGHRHGTAFKVSRGILEGLKQAGKL